MLKADLRGARKGDGATPPAPPPPAPPPRSGEFGPSEARGTPWVGRPSLSKTGIIQEAQMTRRLTTRPAQLLRGVLHSTGAPVPALPPAYCLRDPRIRPTAEQIRAKGVVTSPTAGESRGRVWGCGPLARRSRPLHPRFTINVSIPY